MHVWNKVYHTEANIGETSDTVERTVLNLPFNGHAQDVDAMLEFYDNPEELTYVISNPHSSTESIANECCITIENAKKYMRRLINIKLVIPEGGNKNRTYISDKKYFG